MCFCDKFLSAHLKIKIFWNLFFLDLKMIISVLLLFREILFALRQCKIFFISKFMILLTFLIDRCPYNKLVSSAKWCMSACSVTRCMSLIYIRNNKGPSIDPWGTPDLTLRVSEVELLIEVNWVLFFKYFLNRYSGVPRTPYANFDISISWLTVSKAYEKYTTCKIAVVKSFSKISVMFIKAWLVEWELRKVNCWV